MFGIAGDGCPSRFRLARDHELATVVDVLRKRGPACAVPELFMLGTDRCRVAVCVDETPPAVLIEPTAPKITLAVHGRAGSIGVRQYLSEVEAGVGFVAPSELEPVIAAMGRRPAVLPMPVLSTNHVRPVSRGGPPGTREPLGPQHEEAVDDLPAEGRGFLECYHSVAEFLAEPLPGVASVVDDQIVSICVVYARFEDACEIAAYTRPEHRGQGHGAAVAAECLRLVLSARGQPVWTAVDDASRRLGIKVGLTPVGEKLYVMFERPAA
jgi:GNAT superfamily N-acetyltransferase